MGPKGPRRQEPESVALARIKHRTIGLAVDRAVVLLRTVVKAAAATYGVHAGHEMVKSLANGKIDWNGVAAAVLQGHAANWICISIAGIASVVAIQERKLRRTVTSSQAEYIKKLEQIVDPHRSSSNLLPSGTNRKEDGE